MSDGITPESERIQPHADFSIEVSEEEKKRREREWLLADMDPTEFRRPRIPVFTEPGPGAAQLTDGTPEQLAAWVEKEQARLIESTGFDLRVPSDGDAGPVRPDEEPTP